MNNKKTKQEKTKNLNNFEFLQDYLLVSPLYIKEAGALEKPIDREDKAELGEVLKVGEGRLLDNGEFIKPDINVGDIVFYGKWTPSEVRIESEDYLIVKMEDVIAVYHEKR